MCILCVLGPLFFRSPLYRLVLTRSRCASSCPKRTNFGPFGPPDRPKGPLSPSNCAKFAGAEGADPPLRPPPAPLRGTWLGYAQPEAPKKSPPSAEDRGQLQSKTHRTANSAKAVISEFPTVWPPLFSRLLSLASNISFASRLGAVRACMTQCPLATGNDQDLPAQR